MTAPKRIQRKRTKGWRMPEGAVYVGRPTKWGNPYRWDRYPASRINTSIDGEQYVSTASPTLRRRWAVCDFENGVLFGKWLTYPAPDEIRAELAGKDLACWCPLEDAHGNRVPCHADVLLEIANGGDS